MFATARSTIFCTSVTVLYITTPALADLRVVFNEGAPKDRFKIENTGNCIIEDSRVTLDLSTSLAGLIFDVTDRGAGVEVFQPFQLIEGIQALSSIPQVRDGQSEIVFDIVALDPGASIEFTIDVDDTLGEREITVSGSEIEGATVSYSASNGVYSTSFSSLSKAVLAIADCET